MSDSFRIRTEWLAADGVASAQLAATFCRLEMWVGDRCITRVEDRIGGSVRDGIFCSAYPLAEWIATHWWSLRWHVRAATRHIDPRAAWGWSERRPIDHRHDVRAAGDGFLWPELSIIPEGQQTLLTWSERRGDASDPIRYLTAGARYVPTDDLFAKLGAFIETVIARLDARDAPGSVLVDEWMAIAESDDDEIAFCRAAAALGADPFDVEPHVAALLQGLGQTLGDDLTIELAEAADPKLLAEDVRWVQNAEKVLRKKAAPNGALAGFRQALQAAGTTGIVPPYEVGWDQARIARKVLGADATRKLEIEKIVSIHGRQSVDPAVQGVGMSRVDDLSVVVGSRGGRPAARFLAGRALWRAIHARPERLFLLTNANTWSHRVERAFAAELLAPAAGIREQIGDTRVVDVRTVEDLARHFGVAGMLVRHQLDNQLSTPVID